MPAFELVRFYAKLLDKRQICRWELRGERWDYKQNWIRQSDKSFILSFVNPARSPLRGFGSLLTQDINSWLVLFLFQCCLYFRLQPPTLCCWCYWFCETSRIILLKPFLSHDALSIITKTRIFQSKHRSHYIWYLYFCCIFCLVYKVAAKICFLFCSK